MRKILGLSASLLLAAAAAFSVELRPIEGRIQPPTAVVFTPQAASLQPDFSPTLAAPLAASVLQAQDLAITPEESAPQAIVAAGQMASTLSRQLADGNIAAAGAALGRAFDKRAGYEKAKPLPAAQSVDSPLADLDSGHEMYVSHSYPGKPAVNPQEKIAEAVEEYIAFKGMPNSQKHFVFKFFEIGDPVEGKHSQVVQAIAKLVKAGIKTTILTDFNQCAEGIFAKDEPESTDFEHMTYKDNGPGRALKYIREELGFRLKYGESPFTVLSGVPFYNSQGDEEKPLMHDKGIFALGPDGKAYRSAWTGTANMNATEESTGGAAPAYGGRYNRIIRSQDPEANQFDWEHALGEIEAYDKRLGPKGLTASLDVPRRVNYPNGEFRELAFTNGKQNPNDRITAMLLRGAKALVDAKAARSKPDFEISEIIFSHFVLTNTPEVDALRKYLAALKAYYPADFAKRLKVYGVFDQKFISPSGWGEAAALDGILVQRPMGRSIFGFSGDVLPLMELYGYVRLMDGVDQIDPEGVPTKVHLWHDKTTMMKVIEKGIPWTYAWTRSLNDSMHFESMESQDMYRMRPGSRLAKDFEESIKAVVKAEPQYALPFSKAVVMSWLTQFTQHTYYDSGMPGYADRIIDALGKANYQTVSAVLAEIVQLPTKHINGIAGTDIKERVARFVDFLSWYAQQARKDASLYRMTYRKAVNIGVSLAADNALGLRIALETIYYNPSRGDAKTAELLKKAWTEGLKMTIPLPQPKARKSNVAVVPSGIGLFPSLV